MKKLLIPLALLLLTGCAKFSNDAHKSLYVASTMADGAMKAYGTYWKDQVIAHGDTPALEQQKTNAMALSVKVGATLSVANNALNTYDGNVGTNTTTKAVVTALIQTAVQEAGSFAATIGVLTGNTNLANIH